jgi:hypothetical protein
MCHLAPLASGQAAGRAPPLSAAVAADVPTVGIASSVTAINHAARRRRLSLPEAVDEGLEELGWERRVGCSRGPEGSWRSWFCSFERGRQSAPPRDRSEDREQESLHRPGGPSDADLLSERRNRDRKLQKAWHAALVELPAGG